MKIEKEWLKVQTTFEEIDQQWTSFESKYNTKFESERKTLQSFKAKFVADDVVWLFRSPFSPTLYKGYCIVRNDEIVEYYTTVPRTV